MSLNIFQSFQHHGVSPGFGSDQQHNPHPSPSHVPPSLHMLNILPKQILGIKSFGRGGIFLGIGIRVLQI